MLTKGALIEVIDSCNSIYLNKEIIKQIKEINTIIKEIILLIFLLIICLIIFIVELI